MINIKQEMENKGEGSYVYKAIEGDHETDFKRMVVKLPIDANVTSNDYCTSRVKS